MLSVGAPWAHAQHTLPPPSPVRYDADYADPAFYAGRRQALLDGLPDTALVVVMSAPVHSRDNDVTYPFRQSSDLYYLTGTEEPGSVLLLAPHGIEVEGRTVHEVLFVPERTDFSDTWLGRRFGPTGAKEVLGVAEALPASSFEHVLRLAMQDPAAPLYTLPLPPGRFEDAELAAHGATVAPLLETQPNAAVRSLRLRRRLNELRAVKHPEELNLMRRAIDITALALRAAMRAAEAGMHEYELEAVVEYTFHREGAESPAFPSIIGSGENALILHYVSNRREMQAGDLVLMDVGAEYHNYAADVTRTIPVDGTFSPEQASLYQLVLDAQEAAIEATRAGNAFSATHDAAKLVLAEGLRRLGIMKDGDDVMNFLLHGVSHYLGLSVHDVVPGNGQLVPGNVITVEPGLYIKPSPHIDPRWWNIGIRIEDDVLVTDGDPVVLSADAPKSIAEIEAVMLEECAPSPLECG